MTELTESHIQSPVLCHTGSSRQCQFPRGSPATPSHAACVLVLEHRTGSPRSTSTHWYKFGLEYTGIGVPASALPHLSIVWSTGAYFLPAGINPKLGRHIGWHTHTVTRYAFLLMPFGAEARVALGDPRAAAALEDALRDGGGLAWLRGGAHEEGSARAERIVGTQLCKLVWQSGGVSGERAATFVWRGEGGDLIIPDHCRVIIADHCSV